ncbi:TraB/GumN family protein [Archaeoglobus profundus]|uniref:TraB family protein n=1 Tax=Archaeoglobus profundus (strain DSM 5631 / JCM 9629 / NBRC 100127 / Av18) TaxID=572546 RepID=D2RGL7_ARCPA|nr:TraB/GumN family protein [Archaeoglobus profundus]ADB57442.1 TraB family protein [Archaeoglobus profundus DSM 5631]
MAEVYIVGTAHVLRESVEKVHKVIEEVNPDAVAVELCPRRYNALINNVQSISLSDVLKSGNISLALLQIVLAYFQRKIGEETGVRPGEEMLTAIKKARELGADVLLIDRDIGITFQRLWQKMSFFEKLKFGWNILKGLFSKEDVEDVASNVDSLIEEFRKISPKAGEVLIDERDAYMAYNIIRVSERYNKIVVVVGAGHKKGIEGYLKNPEKLPPIEKLLEVKKGKFSLSKAFGWILSALIVGTFAYILTKLGSEMALKAFMYWFLINGTLSALGATLALAHPLSILAAFLCAWLTSINPLVAAGWVSGYVELKMRKPSVDDLISLSNASSLKDLWRNKAFRVLLVAALTNIGSIIGTIYGAYVVLQMTGIDIRKLLIP